MGRGVGKEGEGKVGRPVRENDGGTPRHILLGPSISFYSLGRGGGGVG